MTRDERARAFGEVFEGMVVVNHHDHFGWQFREWADRDLDLPAWIFFGYVQDDFVASGFRRDLSEDRSWDYLRRDGAGASRTEERMAEMSAHLDRLRNTSYYR